MYLVLEGDPTLRARQTGRVDMYQLLLAFPKLSLNSCMYASTTIENTDLTATALVVDMDLGKDR